MRRLMIALGLAAMLWIAASPSYAQSATCSGKFLNPLTDVCWSCIFPLKIGGTTVRGGGQEDVPGSLGAPNCSCVNGVNVTVGVTTQFWEPLRIFEAVRKPFCFPTLGGLSLNFGIDAPDHGRQPPPIGGERRVSSRKAFYQGHWYVNPMLWVLSILADNSCLEQAYFDLAYITELDPLWNDDEATFILNPDAVLFGNPVAMAACMGDCVAATAGFPISELFWCAGCQQGTIYPLTGNVAHMTGGVQTFALLLQRMTNKLHRQGLMWAASGSNGLCGYYMQPIMDRRNYKFAMLSPRPQPKVAGRCCQPYGRSSLLYEAGMEFPYGGEDFSALIYRKRDCCTGMNIFR